VTLINSAFVIPAKAGIQEIQQPEHRPAPVWRTWSVLTFGFAHHQSDRTQGATGHPAASFSARRAGST